MSDLTVVVLAAGEGTRMRSATPKVLHPLCGRPLVLWPVLAAQAAGAAKVVVVDGPREPLADALPEGVERVVQRERNGTADAVKAAVPHIAADSAVVILMGDVPLITAEAIAGLVDAHAEGATVMTMDLDDPGSYGRVVRDGDAIRVVEARDATPEELAVTEVNTGIYCFDGGALTAALERVTPDNAQGEYYLPDVLTHMPARTHVVDDPALTLGVNDRADLAAVRAIAQDRIHRHHLKAGVTIVDPRNTVIDADLTIGQDTVIEPGCTIKAGSVVGSGCTLRQAYLDQAWVADGVTIGPFAYLRPGTRLERGARVGSFVEIKNSVIGEGSKVPHLSYIGDADVGSHTNLGAATITANYDGVRKHRTTIGSDVSTSVDTTLVAPVTVGDGAQTAAGSVITDDIPENGLGIARARQVNKSRRRPPGVDSEK